MGTTHELGASEEAVAPARRRLRRDTVGIAIDGAALPRCFSAAAAAVELGDALAHIGSAGAVRDEQRVSESAAAAAVDALHGAPSGAAFLSLLPDGAYTTMRTSRSRAAVVSLSFHVQRLIQSLRLIRAARHDDASDDASDDAWTSDERGMRQMLVRSMLAAMCARDGEHCRAGAKRRDETDNDGDEEAEAEEEGKKEEAVIVAHIPHGRRARHHLYVRVSPMPRRTVPPGRRGVTVEVRGVPRENPEAKDSAWVQGRKALELAQQPGTEETLLIDADGYMYEGLTSNFFAIERDERDDAPNDDEDEERRLVRGCRLVTTGSGVLLGHIRELVLRACARRGVPVRLSPAPHVCETRRWHEVFLAGTTRIVLPVERMRFADGERDDWVMPELQQIMPLPRRRRRKSGAAADAAPASMTECIRRWVEEEMERASEPLTLDEHESSR